MGQAILTKVLPLLSVDLACVPAMIAGAAQGIGVQPGEKQISGHMRSMRVRAG